MEKKALNEVLYGERIFLKRHEISLAQKMFDYVIEDKERLSKYLPWPANIHVVDDENKFINFSKNNWDNFVAFDYGIYRNLDNEYMGNISAIALNWNSCSCEIGYWILGKFEGQGYISDAVKILEKNLFDNGFNRIVVRVDPDNVRSQSVPKRLNYFLEGIAREAILVNGEFRDLNIFSKLKKDIRKL